MDYEPTVHHFFYVMSSLDRTCDVCGQYGPALLCTDCSQPVCLSCLQTDYESHPSGFVS